MIVGSLFAEKKKLEPYKNQTSGWKYENNIMFDLL
jgi:hypothetical protein